MTEREDDRQENTIFISRSCLLLPLPLCSAVTAVMRGDAVLWHRVIALAHTHTSLFSLLTLSSSFPCQSATRSKLFLAADQGEKRGMEKEGIAHSPPHFPSSVSLSLHAPAPQLALSLTLLLLLFHRKFPLGSALSLSHVQFGFSLLTD